LSKELDINIKHFNEAFIENLSQSLSGMFLKPATAQKDEVEMAEQAPMITEEHESDEDSDSDEVEIPRDEREQQQVLESSDVLKKEDEEIRANLQQQEKQIVSLEDNLKGKESLLQTIKEQHRLLSNNLLDAMKNEYHKKIL